MSKRRINKQQSARIQKLQTDYQQANDENVSLNEDGLVITRFIRDAEVEDNQGKRIRCCIRPNIDSLVAGDRIVWQPTADDRGVVVSRYPRHCVLERQSKYRGNKAIAANITQLVVVVAPKPALSWTLLDSYLVMAENLQVKLTIVLNKIDLPCDDIKKELTDYYKLLDYPIIFTGKNDLPGFELLQNALKNHTSVFVGQSGVGKSSLIASVLPHENNIQIAAISTVTELGCHTTSNSRFYHLPKGGALIDSPGVREFCLGHLPIADIIYGFREFRDLVQNCKFRNCNHIDSPRCAIINAIKEGNISQKRYDSLIKITMQLAVGNY